MYITDDRNDEDIDHSGMLYIVCPDRVVLKMSQQKYACSNDARHKEAQRHRRSNGKEGKIKLNGLDPKCQEVTFIS